MKEPKARFREYSFYEDIDCDKLQQQFYEAWNYLEAKYPQMSLIASDLYVITVCDTVTDTSSNYCLGEINGQPCIQNIDSKEVILLNAQ